MLPEMPPIEDYIVVSYAIAYWWQIDSATHRESRRATIKAEEKNETMHSQ
jgi:hypothetical protein